MSADSILHDPFLKWGSAGAFGLLVVGLALSPGPWHSVACLLFLAWGAVAGFRAGPVPAFVSAVGFHMAFGDSSNHSALRKAFTGGVSTTTSQMPASDVVLRIAIFKIVMN